MIFNLVAIVLSTVAFASSTYIALRFEKLQRAANFTPAYLEVLKQYQSMQFHDHYRYVTAELPTEHDSKLGISGLPDDARRAVYDIAYFFQGYGMLRLLRILDDEVLPTVQPRIVAVWDAIEPFVTRERELQGAGGLYFFRVLEEFADDVKALPPESLNAMLTRRRFVQIRRRLRALRQSTGSRVS